MEGVLHAEHHAEQPAAAAAQQPGPGVRAVAQLVGGAAGPAAGSPALAPGTSRITIDTSAVDTPARAATSARVGRRPVRRASVTPQRSRWILERSSHSVLTRPASCRIAGTTRTF